MRGIAQLSFPPFNLNIREDNIIVWQKKMSLSKATCKMKSYLPLWLSLKSITGICSEGGDFLDYLNICEDNNIIVWQKKSLSKATCKMQSYLPLWLSLKSITGICSKGGDFLDSLNITYAAVHIIHVLVNQVYSGYQK